MSAREIIVTREGKQLEAEYGKTRWGDRALYHGTNFGALKKIAQEGLKPRGNKHGNWHETVKSNPDAVYLTSAYGLYFAQQCTQGRERLVILEVNIEKIQYRLQADEDAIEQIMRGRDKLPQEWDMKRRTIFYRNRTHLFKADLSLAVLGTCGHHGVIAPENIERVAVIDFWKAEHMMFFGLDPFISTTNFQWAGENYRDWSDWLFNEKRREERWCAPKYREILKSVMRQELPTLDRDGIRIYDNLSSALTKEQ